MRQRQNLPNRAITDDSNSEAEVKKASNNDAQKDTEKTEENSDTEETISKKDSEKQTSDKKAK